MYSYLMAAIVFVWGKIDTKCAIMNFSNRNFNLAKTRTRIMCFRSETRAGGALS